MKVNRRGEVLKSDLAKVGEGISRGIEQTIAVNQTRSKHAMLTRKKGRAKKLVDRYHHLVDEYFDGTITDEQRAELEELDRMLDEEESRSSGFNLPPPSDAPLDDLLKWGSEILHKASGGAVPRR